MEVSDSEFQSLVGYIKTHYGINLFHKRHLVESRLGHMLTEKGFGQLGEYMDWALADASGREIAELLAKLTTNHTFFLREMSLFHYFRDRVLPYLKATVRDRDLRVWSAGCSSGEEPYTLAMIMADYFAHDPNHWEKKILATDISVKALESARQGIYPADSLEGMPRLWRLNYFQPMPDDACQVSDRIRQEIVFRLFNLMEEPYPFRKKFHVIFCKNVMIYFDNPTKARLIEKFYQATEPGGYLFIGLSETINRQETPYQYIMPAIYRKE